MITTIYYFLKSDTEEMKEIKANNFRIYIYKGNLERADALFLGQRAHTVYVDKEFNTHEYQDIINWTLKPLACLQGGEGFVFI
jgi:hypothetical protein